MKRPLSMYSVLYCRCHCKLHCCLHEEMIANFFKSEKPVCYDWAHDFFYGFFLLIQHSGNKASHHILETKRKKKHIKEEYTWCNFINDILESENRSTHSISWFRPHLKRPCGMLDVDYSTVATMREYKSVYSSWGQCTCGLWGNLFIKLMVKE